MFGAQLPASTPFFPGALADGYLISSAADLASFADVIATGLNGDQRFVSDDVLAQMHSPPEGVSEDPEYGSTYGFGLRVLDVEGAQMLWHEGELATEYADVGVLEPTRAGLIVLSTQNGQLYAGDAPFLSGIERLAGEPAEPDDGGFRAVALSMTVLAALVVAGMVTDAMRWPRLARRPRAQRLLRSTLPRVIAAAVLWAGTVFGLGAMLGFEGAVPFPVLWAAAPDLTAVVFGLVGYLVLSAGALLLPDGIRTPGRES
ncbi:serine hydrolase [Microbacterium sp. gxy059]|uniref:serine hydrolase n=1 Tax=Microbacterium sp. gxy059 TaxID=2957199 RepID=UPI003D9625FF